MENIATSSFSVQATIREDSDECYILTVLFEGMTTEQAAWEFSYKPMKVVQIRYPPPVSDEENDAVKSESINELILIIKCADDAVLTRTKVVYGAFQFCFIIPKVDDPGLDAMLSMFIKSEEQRILKSKEPEGGRLIVRVSTNWRRGLWYYMFNAKLRMLSMEPEEFFVGYDHLLLEERKLEIRHPRNYNFENRSSFLNDAVLFLKLNSPAEAELHRLVELSRDCDHGVTLFIPDSTVMSPESFCEDAFNRMLELERAEQVGYIGTQRESASTTEESDNDEMSVIKEQKQGLVLILAAHNDHGVFYVSNSDHIRVIRDHCGDKVPVQVASSVKNEDKLELKKQIVEAGLKLCDDDNNDGETKDGDMLKMVTADMFLVTRSPSNVDTNNN